MSITANTDQLSKLAKKLVRQLPADVKKALQKSIKQAGQVVADDAKERASEIGHGSGKIPGTIRVGANGATAVIRAGNARVPEAALMEGNGTPGAWRHPLFGNKKHWYTEERHPYLYPALLAKQDEAGQMLRDSVVDAINQGLN